MPGQAVRPPGVPETAVWEPDSACWEAAPPAPDGPRAGPVRRWREDGALLFEGAFAGGLLEGPFRHFHADGSLARQGAYAQGELDGEVTACASPRDDAEPLRACCVPPGAVRLAARYQAGSLLSETFFDEEGFALCSDGRRRPPRPEGVPDHAAFEEGTSRWCAGPPEAPGASASGVWAWWRQDATLSEEATYDRGRRVARRHFDEQGRLREAVTYRWHEGYDEVREGPWRLRVDPSEAATWGVPAARAPAWVYGHFEAGQHTGVWRALDTQEGLVWERALGGPIVLPPIATDTDAFSETSASAAIWEDRAREWQGSGRVREALVAAARTLAASGTCARFHAFVSAAVLPRGVADAAELARSPEPRGVDALLDALVAGAEPAETLRQVAAGLPPWSRAARELAEAAVCLAPERASMSFTRALVALERGEDETIARDRVRLAEASPEAAAFFETSLRVLRPLYAFRPAQEHLEAAAERIPLELSQPLDRVRAAARVYATRLLLVRRALAPFGCEHTAWAPPVLEDFLAEGPVQLACHEAEIEDVGEDGQPELTKVQIDERIPPGTEGVSALVSRARADWAALCWLSWAVGQHDTAWPHTIAPHPRFPEALALAVERAWRTRDQLTTSGLRAMTQNVASFAFEGHDLTDLPRSLLEVCMAEWLEVRAVLLWLSNEGNLSPFQSDLRQV